MHRRDATSAGGLFLDYITALLAGGLKDAQQWWIRSALIQPHAGCVGDARSFLYLAHCAALLQQRHAHDRQQRLPEQGALGVMDPGDDARRALAMKLAEQPGHDPAAAIDILVAPHCP